MISITPRPWFLVAGALAVAGLAACMSPAPSTLSRRSSAAKSATSSGGATDPSADSDGDADGDTAGNDTDGDNTAPSGTPKASGSSGTSGSSGVTPQACLPAVTSPGDGEHHAGESCGSCHDSMGSAAWTVSGTLFANGGGAGVAGATIEIVDGAGQTLTLKTCANGNFYTTTPVTMPLTVRSSRCPSNAPMAAKVTAGSCNGCHDAGNPIHL